ncbi:MAG TPA: serine hydrolase domain-containing protein [Blastocatellia bacterium]|nr:serine hydrolase domain-containing protein [Blastocatellia bacterium]HMZ22137.1 serine hydrolase domain-containing protein [Blastocatellia bacterium]HNG28432.1 serine hydrolase domain-containing protein [Blastocatellia bacterium]
MSKISLIRLFLFLAAGLLPAVQPATYARKMACPADDGTVSGETGAKLDEYLTRLSRFGFSGSVLVAKEGKVLLHKSYGWADKQKGAPNTNETAFDIASLTKQFTAAAILKLETMGKLKTGDPISKYLPEVPPDKAKITIHHLLTHTSGFEPDFPEGKNITREQFVAGMMKMPLVAEVGKEYIYANSGFCLLAAIVETVAGQPYHKFMAEQFYAPLGMTHTGSYDDAERWRNISVAHGYNESTDNGVPTARPSNWGVRGAYDALTTTGDLYKWVTALRGKKALPEAAIKKMFSSQAPTDQRGVDYGYGWLIDKTNSSKIIISHAGSHYEGFNASCRLFVEDNVLFITTTNRIFGRFESAAVIEKALASIVFNDKSPQVPDAVKIAPDQLAKLAGTYTFPTGAKLDVIAETDHLQISALGQEAIDALVAAAPQEQKRLADFNQRAAAVFTGGAKGDFTALAAEFKRPEQVEEMKKAFTGLWRRFETQHGAFKSLEQLGTVPEPEAMMTYVKLNFERGSEYRRVRWEGGKLAYVLQGKPPLIPTWFVAQSADSFAGYHVVIGRTVKLGFKKDGSLVVLSDKGKTATKL